MQAEPVYRLCQNCAFIDDWTEPNCSLLCGEPCQFGTARELAALLAKEPRRVLVMQGERYLAIDGGSINMPPYFYEISQARANDIRAKEHPSVYIWETD
jgi:hypothetical protein